MILTHVLDQTTRIHPLEGDGNVNVYDIHSVPFTFENFGERDYEIVEITSDKEIVPLDISDNVLSLPLIVPSGSQTTFKLNFVIEDREFLPLSVSINTTEQGRTDHVIRISQEVVEPIEEPTSELQVVGNVIDFESDLAGEVLSTSSSLNPYTITFNVKNIGVTDLDIFELSFVDNELNKHDITVIGQDTGDANCVTNGSNIGSGETKLISFTIDLSSTGLFGTNLLPLDVDEDISRDGFQLSEIGSIYMRTNSLKRYYSPIRFSEDLSTTVDVGIFIIPIIGVLYVSSAIEILSNTEGTYDKRKQEKISLENLIINTNRRTEQIIIKNYGIDSFEVIDIVSNYEVSSSDALSYYEYGSELTKSEGVLTTPLTINGGETRYIDIYFDDVQMIDDADSINLIDDVGSQVSLNKTFYKTLTITTEPGVFNTDDNDQLNITVPFSIYKNQYLAPYDWIFVETRNRMSLKNSNDVFYSGATYELPFGYGLRKMQPSEQKVTQIRVKNNDLSETKYFRIEIVDNNKYWKNKPYLVQGGINTSVDKENALYFQLKPGETTGTAPKGSGLDVLGDNLPILCIVQTNSGEEMEYEYMTADFHQKYDLSKEGENIVIKVTEGTWVDDDFIVKTDLDGVSGYYVEKSMVQYIVATWKGITFNYWSTSNYSTVSYYPIPNENEWVEFFRPRDLSLYSVSNYQYEDPYYPEHELLYTSQTIIPLTRAWAVSKVDPPTESLFQQGFLQLFSNSTYSLPNFNVGMIEGEVIDFDLRLPFQTFEKYSVNRYTIDYSIYPNNEWINTLEIDTVTIPSKTIEKYSVNNYYHEGLIALVEGDAVVVPPLGYEIRTHWSTTHYEYINETVRFNWTTHSAFSSSTYEITNDLIALSPKSVQPPSFKTWTLFNVNNYTYESTGSDQHKKEELKLVAPELHIWYSLSKFFPVFDWTGDMFPQLVVDVVGNSVPKTIENYSSNNYKFNFVPAFVETGRWEVIKPPS